MLESPTSLTNQRVALVHDWYVTRGGAERVAEEIFAVVPHADLFALVDFYPDEHRHRFANKPVTTSFLQSLPGARRHYRSFLPLMPYAIEQFDLSSYDVVISSSHAVAHGVLTNCEQLHLSYINNTMVYAWDLYHHYLRSGGLTRGVKGLIARAALHYIRLWDQGTGSRVNTFIANSGHMADRLQRLYGCNADVIYPPVETDRFAPVDEREDYYVAVARLVPFKRIDIMVDAFRNLPDRRLVILGDGPELEPLRRRASDNIEFRGFCDPSTVARVVARARAFLFTSVEPFGIAVIEAAACGVPVIALGRGAAREIVIDGVTGCLFEHQDAESLRDAILSFESSFEASSSSMIQHARQFSSERFRSQLARYLDSAWEAFTDSQASVRAVSLHAETVPNRLGIIELSR